jgi:hypothetical protein
MDVSSFDNPAPLSTDTATGSTFAVLASEEAAPDTENPAADVNAEVKPVELTGVDPVSGEVLSGGDDTAGAADAGPASSLATDDATAAAGEKPSVPAATDEGMEAEDAGAGAMAASISAESKSPDPSANFQGSSEAAGAASTNMSLEAKPVKNDMAGQDEEGKLAEEMEKKAKLDDTDKPEGESLRLRVCLCLENYKRSVTKAGQLLKRSGSHKPTVVGF